MFQVLYNNKPCLECSEYKIGDWKTDTFNTKKEAEIFAYLWAYPIDKKTAKEWSDKRGEMELNKEYNMTISYHDVNLEKQFKNVTMKIVEIPG